MKHSCGAELPEEAIFCKKCGKQVRCMKCKSMLYPSARFCGNCREPVQTFTAENKKIVKKKINGRNAGIIAAICMIVIASVAVCLFGFFSKKSIHGIWRMNEGSFSLMNVTFDTCAIDFRSDGEYIIYTGIDYQDVNMRGSYTYDSRQITLIVADYVPATYNYSLNGNQLSIVSSGGAAAFTKVNPNVSPVAFDESVVSQQYIDQGYLVESSNLISKNTNERIYHTTILKSYAYMDEQVIREDMYSYSKIGEMWYLNESSDYNRDEDWHILGLWTYDDGRAVTTLRFYSFDGSEAYIEYDDPAVFPQIGFQYSGTVSAISGGEGLYVFLLRTDYSQVYTTIYISRDDGVSSSSHRFTYEGEDSSRTGISDVYGADEFHDDFDVLNNEIEEVKTSEKIENLPILLECQYYDGHRYTATDSYGNKYEDGYFELVSWHNEGEEPHRAYAIIKTNQEWQFFRGTFFTRKDQERDFEISFQIYADDREVYVCDFINRETYPIDFEVDIGFAESIRIQSYSEDYTFMGRNAGIVLVNAEVYNQ